MVGITMIARLSGVADHASVASQVNLCPGGTDQSMTGILLVPSRGWSRAVRRIFQAGGGFYSVTKFQAAKGHASSKSVIDRITQNN